MSINGISACHTLQEMFSILNYNSIPSLSPEFEIARNEFHNTRQNSLSNLKLAKIQKNKNPCFVAKGIKLWNALPPCIKSIKKKAPLSGKVKEWVQSHLPT